MVLLNPIKSVLQSGKLLAFFLFVTYNPLLTMLHINNCTKATESCWVHTIKNNPQEKTIIGIIQDSIIWGRVSGKVYDILNSFQPLEDEHQLDVMDKYFGYHNAIHLMGLENNNNLSGELDEIYCRLSSIGVKKNNKADDLAQEIYREWVVCFENHYCRGLKTNT